MRPRDVARSCAISSQDSVVSELLKGGFEGELVLLLLTSSVQVPVQILEVVM